MVHYYGIWSPDFQDYYNSPYIYSVIQLIKYSKNGIEIWRKY